jgi:bifunctional DNA-binding transcriptional regulator/antitoxin component of YhaV-PrlF toxin-antitoxin module
MIYLVGTKGQVVIAKEIREQLGVKPGWVALQRLVGDRVEIYFLPPEHQENLKGSLASYIQTRVAPGAAWDSARHAAWEKAAQENNAAEPEA